MKPIQSLCRRIIVAYHKIQGRGLKTKDISIISNNCLGADMCHSFGLRFNSPTVNLQILPSDFIKFCVNLKEYLSLELTQNINASDTQKEEIWKIYGRDMEQLEFPIASCGDILVFLQHFKTFEEGKEAWEERKARVNTDKCGYVLICGEAFHDVALMFDKAHLDNKVFFSENYHECLKNTPVFCVDTPENIHFMTWMSPTKKYYEKEFDTYKWLCGLGN